MRGDELIEFIVENGLEDYEVMIQPPIGNYGSQTYSPIPLENGDIDWNEDKEVVFIG